MPPFGVFGGTFDPIHFGHLRLAEEMAEALSLERVLFIPAGQPPHRGAPRTASAHRLEMVRRAVAGNPRFAADAREVNSTRPSYTVDTLTALRGERGVDQPLWLLLGADTFLDLPSWHEWRQLFKLAHIAVAARPGSRLLQPDVMQEALKNELSQRQLADAPAAGPAGSVLLRRMTQLGRILQAPPVLQVQYGPDDAYYYLQLAKNFTRFGYWTFDSGFSITSGFHLMQAYTLAGIYWLFEPEAIGLADWDWS